MTTTGSAAVHSLDGLDGEPYLGVVTKRAYRLERSRRAPPLAETPPLRVKSAYEPLANDIRINAESEILGFHTVVTDLLLTGHAYSHRGPVAELDTGIAIGEVKKTVRVTGDRAIVLGPGGALGATRPAPFSSLPLDWQRAYGGRDAYAEKKLYGKKPKGIDILKATKKQLEAAGAISYPRNRIGRGFFIDLDRERLEGAPLPNLSDPHDPVTPERLLAKDPYDWVARPAAASYGPIDPLTFPRCMFHLLQPDMGGVEPRAELAAGALLSSDLRDRQIGDSPDPRYFNCAPAGLATRQLRGDEKLSLWNLHRDHERFECELPADAPRLMIEPPGCSAFELTARLASVLVEPDADRLTLTWIGAMRVAAVFPDPMCASMRHAVVWSR